MERNERQKFLVGTYLNIILEKSDEREESSDESDSAEIINSIKNYFERVPKLHCNNYIENVVLQYTDSDFKSHFR